MKPAFLVCILGCLIVALPRATALELAGVNIPPQVVVSGSTLKLNGAGLRTVTFAFIPIKAYVAALYAPAPLRSAKEVFASLPPGPLQFNFTFLRSVGQGQVTDAWTAQFKSSVSYTYPDYDRDRDAFVKMFGPLATYGVESVVIDGDQTRVYDGTQLKGSIAGRDFQKSFLSLWFGSNPVMPSLKDELLGG